MRALGVVIALVCMTATGCGSGELNVAAARAIAFAHRYGVTLLVHRDCRAAKQLETSPGLGCDFTSTFHGTTALSFQAGSARFRKNCKDVVSGQGTGASCVVEMLVGYDARDKQYNYGTFQIYLAMHKGHLLVDDLALGDGGDCLYPEFPCPTERELWAERVTG